MILTKKTMNLPRCRIGELCNGDLFTSDYSGHEIYLLGFMGGEVEDNNLQDDVEDSNSVICTLIDTGRVVVMSQDKSVIALRGEITIKPYKIED
jgi:hypothetical protein